MFFVFSKLLEFFIYPLTWVLALLIAALITKKQKLKHGFLVCSTALLLIFSDPFLLNQFAKLWDIAPVPLKSSGQYSCAIVLGGFTIEGANGNGIFSGNADRFIQGLKLFTTSKVSHILISSGNGNLLHDNFREADWVKTQLQQFKIPDSAILIEYRSRNTIENAAFSKLELTANHLQPPYILVTSAFHMRRSMGIFRKAKLDVIPYPCNYLAGKGNTNPGDFVPDANAFFQWDIYIKEVVGTAVNYLK
ncbi:MAG TPA: YdcF family protein [Mucilaginibacter sp.]